MWELAARKLPYANVPPDVVKVCVCEGEREEFLEEWECPGKFY
jgi:hypothetical protein